MSDLEIVCSFIKQPQKAIEMKTSIKLSIFAMCLTLSNVNAAAIRNSGSYLTFHYDIKVAMEELDYKKAKSLVESLIPVLDADIAYTKATLSEEDDEYIINKLTSQIERQEEILQKLEEFLGEKKKNLAEFDSLDVIRELRRLSIKPKER